MKIPKGVRILRAINELPEINSLAPTAEFLAPNLVKVTLRFDPAAAPAQPIIALINELFSEHPVEINPFEVVAHVNTSVKLNRVMTPDEFRERWESDPDGGDITIRDMLKCAKAWCVADDPKVENIDQIFDAVLKVAGIIDPNYSRSAE